jgi:hypothetical protein
MDIIERLLRIFLAGRVRYTEHVLDSLDDDRLTRHDVLACVGTGRLRRSHPRERKYEIEGRSMDGRTMRVVVRLTGPRRLRIITAYEVH